MLLLLVTAKIVIYIFTRSQARFFTVNSLYDTYRTCIIAASTTIDTIKLFIFVSRLKTNLNIKKKT